MAGFNVQSLCQISVRFVRTVSVCLLALFRFVSAYIFRLQGHGGVCLKNEEKEINVRETEPELLPREDVVAEVNSFEEEEEPEVYLKFKFPTYEEFRQVQKESGNGLESGVVPYAAASEFEFPSLSTSVDEPETFPVKEIGEADRTGCVLGDDGNGFPDGNLDKRGSDGEKGMVDGWEGEGIGAVEFAEKMETEQKEEGIKGSHEFLGVDSGSTFDSDTDSDSTSFEHMNLMNHLVDSYRGGFLDEYFRGEFNGNVEMESGNEWPGFHENQDGVTEDCDDKEIFDVLALRKFEERILQNRDGLTAGADDTHGVQFDRKDADPSEKTELDNSSDEDDESELESLWEHQELVEQLKMELKKVRATGMPTILEESESPKIMDDLKPWKIDEFQREDCIGDLHKFYKSYRERMRKFDIINYQKMYAMGVLQLRDPLQFMSEQKSSAPGAVLRSFLLQKLPTFRNKIHGNDPTKKLIQELQADLEVVYVGQVCLSWEFLNWQYEKVLDLWDSDPRGMHEYNEVAGEFQQFQVLLQRFVEDEPFQEQPRMQNYVRTRAALRNLLQVPIVREDNMKDKRWARKRVRHKDEYVITSDMLVEIVEESIRIFWRFVRADKDCTTAAISGHKKIPEVSSPEDLKLLTETRKTLLKKDRKLKDLLRSENCVLRKLRRCREDGNDSDQVLYFFAQVDMKVVCRVLNMAKITRDHLIWCHKKLERISFVDRKIHVEPAFLLFPS